MTKGTLAILLGILAALVLMAYLVLPREASAPETSLEETGTPEALMQAQAGEGNFNPLTANIGEQFGAFTYVETGPFNPNIDLPANDNVFYRFEGQGSITATYRWSDFGAYYLEDIPEEEARQLPHEDGAPTSFCVGHDELFAAAGVDEFDRARIYFSGIRLAHYPSEICSPNIGITRVEKLEESPRLHRSSNGYDLILPPGARAEDVPATDVYAASTRIEGPFGTACFSPGYGCGGKGLQGWEPADMTYFARGNVRLQATVWTRPDDDRVIIVATVEGAVAPYWKADEAQIQVETFDAYLPQAEAMLSSFQFLPLGD